MGNSLKKNIIFNSVGNFIYLACQWLMTVVIVRLAGYETAGIFSLAMSVTTIFYAISTMSLRNFQVSDMKNEYTNEQYIKTRFIACFVTMLACVVFSFFVADSLEKILCISVYMLFKIIESIIDVYHGIDQKHGRMDIIGISMALRGIINIAVFTAVLYFSKNLLVSLVVMTISSCVLFLIYDVPNTNKIKKEDAAKQVNLTKNLFLTAIPLVLYALLVSLIPSIPRFVLENNFGSEMLGIYTSVATPAIILQVSASFVFMPLMTPLARAYEEKDTKAFDNMIKKTMIAIVVLTVICVIGAYFLADFGLSILFGNDIIKYSYLLIPALISSLLLAVVWFVGSLLTIIRAFKEMIIANAVSALICFGISLYLVPIYDMNAVNYSAIIALTINAILQYAILKMKNKGR